MKKVKNGKVYTPNKKQWSNRINHRQQQQQRRIELGVTSWHDCYIITNRLKCIVLAHFSKVSKWFDGFVVVVVVVVVVGAVRVLLSLKWIRQNQVGSLNHSVLVWTTALVWCLLQPIWWATLLPRSYYSDKIRIRDIRGDCCLSMPSCI